MIKIGEIRLQYACAQHFTHWQMCSILKLNPKCLRDEQALKLNLFQDLQFYRWPRVIILYSTVQLAKIEFRETLDFAHKLGIGHKTQIYTLFDSRSLFGLGNIPIYIDEIFWTYLRRNPRNFDLNYLRYYMDRFEQEHKARYETAQTI